MSPILYKLFSHCIFVDGASRSIICDLQRHKYYLIPNSLSQIIDEDVIDVERINKLLDSESTIVFNEYIAFLKQNEVIFECDRNLLANFPKLSTEWQYPSHISNAIFDFENNLPWFDENILTQLETLCCNYLEFRCFGSVDRSDLMRVLHLIQSSQIKSIDLILKYGNEDDFTDWILEIVKNNLKIRIINLHSAPESSILFNDGSGFGIVVKTVEEIKSEKNCGCVTHHSFSVNIPLFTESLKHNSCLNRKISVDKNGNIKNCPSMTKCYGNIVDTSFSQALKMPGFTKYWDITKDQVLICKDCEFRYICTDCRAYVEDPDDLYSKPLKCGYNPYTCEWEDWSKNPLKQEAIVKYGLNK